MTSIPSALLRCPVCRGATIGFSPGEARCGTCGHQSPSLGRVACLLAEPAVWRGRWSTDLGAFASMMRAAAERTRSDLARFDLLPPTRARLEGFLAANERNAAQVRALFADAGIEPCTDREAIRRRSADARGRLPLTHHYELLLRDWAWGARCPENAEALGRVLGMAAEAGWGRTLVLGAGAGRLTYDVHQATDASVTLALDLDPLLSLVAHHVLFGDGRTLIEFPFAPDSDAWVEHELRRPDALRPGMHWLVADALDPPVSAGGWDTVLTAWFIDVCDADVREVIGTVHRLLAPGGRWINTGPLLYPPSRPPAQRYPPAEVLALTGVGGFDVETSSLQEVRYLRSPLSGHARLESVLSFVARKTAWKAGPSAEPPAWVIARHRPIPRFPSAPTGHPLLDRVGALLDGQRSVADVAQALAGALPPDVDARDAAAALVLELHRRGEDA